MGVLVVHTPDGTPASPSGFKPVRSAERSRGASRVIHLGMSNVSIRELRNHGGEVIERVHNGEHVTITKSGTPVAELRPLPRRGPAPGVLLERWRHLPHVDPTKVRGDIDAVIDPSL